MNPVQILFFQCGFCELLFFLFVFPIFWYRKMMKNKEIVFNYHLLLRHLILLMWPLFFRKKSLNNNKKNHFEMNRPVDFFYYDGNHPLIIKIHPQDSQVLHTLKNATVLSNRFLFRNHTLSNCHHIGYFVSAELSNSLQFCTVE